MTEGLHPGERLALYALRERAGEDGTVTVGSRALAQACGWTSRDTARKHLAGLEGHGLIRRVRAEPEDEDRRNSYQLREA